VAQRRCADHKQGGDRDVQTVATPITHAIAGGRDLLRDVVGAAAPAVVTIRHAGQGSRSRRRSSAQDDQNEQDDLFRRFFGEPFGQRGQRGPRQFAPRQQRALGSGVIVSNDGLHPHQQPRGRERG
jgi:S1-C subfamily serine protease